ncbi:MAG: DUF3000 domain-containing protein [Arthrobacter sp.]|uniref:DUF3000 domain-containing protein n=1 Tax=unclassified Arthrobacter TaxID=235627 RepID=UPI002650E5CD|nr:DUF3000 domain-containing protein [Micrococcaceae bacterium]MDN5825384.1 DUF3000 domain-containing protein [Micrococcaceae bacterium]MDN5878765.1 DUF3000 domain-containing protein [Micrococcaceae bacterium]MDN5886512.1 DUF3000 domain-containing protein [Micrococcaceae bacterium]MDN5906670.1 DUF3000 domain-containing protein [Micrococcaceae bacterium]
MTALSGLRQADCRAEMHLAEIPAPARLAPFAVALSAEVLDSPPRVHGSPHGPAATALTESRSADEDNELATGRFILLHDPDGSDLWNGTFRIVTYIRAQLDAEMGNDQMLGSVAWTWLLDALHENDADYAEAGGTATRMLSQSFGSLQERPETIDIELRASWTPQGAELRSHLEAWSDMVCTFAGLPPLPEGVTALPRRRRS